MTWKNREDLHHIHFPRNLLPIKADDWTSWSPWEDLRCPPGTDNPNVGNIPHTMGIYELAVVKHTQVVVYLGSSGNLRQHGRRG